MPASGGTPDGRTVSPASAGANVRLKGLLAAVAAYSGLRAPPRPALRSAKGLKPNEYLPALEYLFPYSPNIPIKEVMLINAKCKNHQPIN